METLRIDDYRKVEAGQASAVAGEIASRQSSIARRKRANRLPAAVRWLHIYSSMFGLAVTLFFSVTGLTLNHADWFYSERTRELTGALPSDLSVSARPVDELRIVEYLRGQHHIRAAVRSFETDDFQHAVSFAAPGYSADVWVDRESGSYELSEVSLGLVAVMNDLHKGRDTSQAWSWLIDISAVGLAVISASGLLLILWLRRKRVLGLLTMAAGFFAVVAVYVICG